MQEETREHRAKVGERMSQREKRKRKKRKEKKRKTPMN